MMTELQTTWNWLVAVYLFLGGLGAGAACTVALIALFTGERFKRTVRFGTWASAIILGLGALVLLVDVGKPFRAMIMFKSFVNFSSWMTIGAWLLLIAVAVNGLAALFWTDFSLAWLARLWKPLSDKRTLFRTILAVVAIPISLGVAIYTGVLLGVLQFRPLWHTWWLPALFTVSALDTGVALVTGFSFLREDAKGVGTLRKVLEASAIVLIAVEATVLVFFLKTALEGSVDAARSAQTLTQGALGPLFWILVVGLGLGMPLLVCLLQVTGVVKVFRKAALVIPLIGASSCLIGGWTLRFVVLSAGLPISLSSPSLMQILNGVRFIP